MTVAGQPKPPNVLTIAIWQSGALFDQTVNGMMTWRAGYIPAPDNDLINLINPDDPADASFLARFEDSNGNLEVYNASGAAGSMREGTAASPITPADTA